MVNARDHGHTAPSAAQRELRQMFAVELRETKWAERLAELHKQLRLAQTADERRRVEHVIDAHYEAQYASDRELATRSNRAR